MPFNESAQPSQNQAIHVPRMGDVVVVTMPPTDFFLAESTSLNGPVEAATAQGDEGQAGLLIWTKAALTRAATIRGQFDEILIAAGERARLNLIPHKEAGDWFAGATAALGLSRLVKQLLGEGRLANHGTDVRADAQWDQPAKGGLHVVHAKLATLGLQAPTNRPVRWFVGDEVYAKVGRYQPSTDFPTYPYGAGVNPNTTSTVKPLIKRGVWQAARSYKRPASD